MEGMVILYKLGKTALHAIVVIFGTDQRVRCNRVFHVRSCYSTFGKLQQENYGSMSTVKIAGPI